MLPCLFRGLCAELADLQRITQAKSQFQDNSGFERESREEFLAVNNIMNHATGIDISKDPRVRAMTAMARGPCCSCVIPHCCGLLIPPCLCGAMCAHMMCNCKCCLPCCCPIFECGDGRSYLCKTQCVTENVWKCGTILKNGNLVSACLKVDGYQAIIDPSKHSNKEEVCFACCPPPACCSMLFGCMGLCSCAGICRILHCKPCTEMCCSAQCCEKNLRCCYGTMFCCSDSCCGDKDPVCCDAMCTPYCDMLCCQPCVKMCCSNKCCRKTPCWCDCMGKYCCISNQVAPSSAPPRQKLKKLPTVGEERKKIEETEKLIHYDKKNTVTKEGELNYELSISSGAGRADMINSLFQKNTHMRLEKSHEKKSDDNAVTVSSSMVVEEELNTQSVRSIMICYKDPMTHRKVNTVILVDPEEEISNMMKFVRFASYLANDTAARHWDLDVDLNDESTLKKTRGYVTTQQPRPVMAASAIFAEDKKAKKKAKKASEGAGAGGAGAGGEANVEESAPAVDPAVAAAREAKQLEKEEKAKAAARQKAQERAKKRAAKMDSVGKAATATAAVASAEAAMQAAGIEKFSCKKMITMPTMGDRQAYMKDHMSSRMGVMKGMGMGMVKDKFAAGKNKVMAMGTKMMGKNK